MKVLTPGLHIATLLDTEWSIIFTIALFTFLCVLYAITAMPIYKANAVVQVEDSAPSIPGLSDMTDMISAENSSDTEIQIIKSRFFIDKADDELQLTNVAKPNYFPFIVSFSPVVIKKVHYQNQCLVVITRGAVRAS
jgi:tyrosine-protein kinase Etk/Wzc